MCDNPSQELSNGFCFDKCPSGWQAFGGMCLKSCPAGFVDHGTTCEPPSVLRKPINAYMSACPDNQVDRNGNCFEPQTTTFIMLNGSLVPKVTGCNCIKRTLAQRLQCTSGYVPFNNGCISKCPANYTDIKDSIGEIASMYCQELCPLKTNSKNVRWPHINGQCVKEYRSRTNQIAGALSVRPTSKTRNTVPKLGKPVTVASELAKKPLGSSLNDRYRAAQSIYKDLGSSPLTNPYKSAIPDSWTSLFADPSSLLIFFVVIAVVIFAGPKLFPLLGSAIGYVFKGLGLLTEKVESGVGSVVSGAGTAAGAIIGSTGTVLADVEKSVGSNVAAAIARPAAKLAAKNATETQRAESAATAQGILDTATAQANADTLAANVKLYVERAAQQAAQQAADAIGIVGE